MADVKFEKREAFALLDQVGQLIEARDARGAMNAVAEFGMKYGHPEVFRFCYAMAGALIDSLGLREKDTTFGMFRTTTGRVMTDTSEAPPGQRDAPAFLQAALVRDIETASDIYIGQPSDSARAALVVQLCCETYRVLQHDRKAHLN